MNIRELAQTIHAHRITHLGWPRPDEVAGVVEKLGNGSFGCAYLLPDGRVLKVGEGVDATCVWINEAAKHFAEHSRPGRAMPVVWEFDTELYPVKSTNKVLVSPGGWVRLPDGALQPIAAQWEDREHVESRAWWYAVMEKVEPDIAVSWHDAQYIEQWGRERGISSTDVYAKNCGRAADGRIVCFDPFYYQPPVAALTAMRTVSTGYTGYKAYPEERKVAKVTPGFGNVAFDALVGLEARMWLSVQGDKLKEYTPEGMPTPVKLGGMKWQAMRKGPIRHGARWG